MHDFVVAGTGHRPNALPDTLSVGLLVVDWLEKNRPDYVYQGMAAGFDLILARACRLVNIPYGAVKPFAGHRDGIPSGWAEEYDLAWAEADARITLSPSSTYPGPWVFHNRNRYMVDRAHHILTYWNGAPKGGTTACLKYAQQKGKPGTNLHPAKPFDGIISV